MTNICQNCYICKKYLNLFRKGTPALGLDFNFLLINNVLGRSLVLNKNLG